MLDFGIFIFKYASSHFNKTFTGGSNKPPDYKKLIVSGTHLFGGPFRPKSRQKTVVERQQPFFGGFWGLKSPPNRCSLVEYSIDAYHSLSTFYKLWNPSDLL